jgi:hypothetical protein
MGVSYEEAKALFLAGVDQTRWPGTFCLDDRMIVETD